MLLGRVRKNFITGQMSKIKKKHSVHLVETVDEIHGQRHVRHLLGPSHRWWKPSWKTRTNHARKQNVHLFERKVKPGHFAAGIQPNFFSQQVVELGSAKELHHVGHAKYEHAINSKAFVPGGFDQIKGRQSVHVTLVNPWYKIPEKKHKAYNTVSLTTTRSTLWTWVACNRRASSSTKALNGCVLYIKNSHPHQGQRRYRSQ